MNLGGKLLTREQAKKGEDMRKVDTAASQRREGAHPHRAERETEEERMKYDEIHGLHFFFLENRWMA